MSVYRGTEYTGGDDVKKIKSYLLMLNEELRYIFSHLEPEENYSEDALRKYLKSGEDIAYLELTAKHLLISMKDAEGNISVLEQTAKSLTTRISDAEGNISEVQQTASSLTTRISNAEGDISTIQQTATSLTSRISDAEKNISIVQQTASSLTTRISNAEGDISTIQQTATSLTSRIGDAEKNISTIQQTAGSLTTRISSAEGNISTIQQTASSLTTRISSAEGNISTIQQTASSLTTRISNAEGSISTIQQTASSLTARISDAEGDISTVQQTAKKISWIVASGSSSSNFTLTSHMAQLVADQINLTGYVTFNDLSRSGSTTINGDNIKTGTLDAALLEIGGSKVFGSSGGSFKIYKDFVPSNISLSQLSVNTISIVNGPTIRGSSGNLSLGVNYAYSKVPSGATDTQIVTAINHIIDWIKKVD